MSNNEITTLKSENQEYNISERIRTAYSLLLKYMISSNHGLMANWHEIAEYFTHE